MGRHEWLTQELGQLHWYAHYLREALGDGELLPAGQNPCAAAAKYLVEWEDIIPDTDPMFGYVDDLFVILLGLDELLHKGGRAGKAYGDKQMPSGATIKESIQEAKKSFKSFWDFIAGEVGAGFQHIARALKKDSGYVGQLIEMLNNYIDAYAQRPVTPVDGGQLETFLSKYTKKAGARR